MAKRVVSSKTPIRILITTDFYRPLENGVSSYVAAIADGLDAKTYAVTVLTYGGEAKTTVHHEHSVQVYRIPRYRFVGDAFRMPRLSAYKTLWAFPRCDVVITNTRFFTLSAVGALLAKRWRAPHVHIEHGAVHVPHQKSSVRAIAWIYDQTIGRCVLFCAKQIITVSRAGISFVKRLGVPEKKVRVIANAVANTTFKRDTRGARILHAKLAIPPKKHVLLFVVRLVREKGVRELITAVQGLPVTIVIVGEGPERGPAETLAQELGVSVRFVGAVPRDSLPAYYSLARLFVNPSWAEGLPTTVLESLACGTPVVATAVGGTGEILPSQALVAPKNVRALRERIQAALRKRSSVAKLPAQYTTPALQASWTAVLHKILR